MRPSVVERVALNQSYATVDMVPGQLTDEQASRLWCAGDTGGKLRTAIELVGSPSVYWNVAFAILPSDYVLSRATIALHCN
mmetsp:Transcript_24406/g.35864  ORF Transcript_24406/g.35864 Transcript_24406/m.35864 type:complete len:81 (+) Transcript_24406:1548-1790(+)